MNAASRTKKIAATEIILLVDDDPAVLSAVEFCFQVEGFGVRSFATAEALLAATDLPGRGCLLIDYRLPGIDGLELLRRLRARGVTLPALLITTPTTHIVRRALADNVPVIDKPLNATALAEQVRRLLKGRVSNDNAGFPPERAVRAMEAIYGRRAVRDYADRPVDPDLIAQVIVDATQAPSSMNRQPWSFSVAAGHTLLSACSTEAKAAALDGASETERKLLADVFANEDFNIFYNAPALVVISATELDAMAMQDCCLAGQTLMLSAYARGLGSCWIGLAETWLRSPEAKKRLRIPEGHTAVAPIVMGYPQASPPPPGRREPAITWVTAEHGEA